MELAVAVRPVGASGAMCATWELMLGICEVGLMAGLMFIQGVYDHHMIRVYRKTRWSPEAIATSHSLGRVSLMIGFAKCWIGSAPPILRSSSRSSRVGWALGARLVETAPISGTPFEVGERQGEG